MCGITGIIKFKEMSPGWGKLEAMTEKISHRGPDATGYYKDGSVELGHRRLSVIDLSVCSNQPMTDHTGRYHIVFNGEIYNYQEVKNDISEYPYSTNGDTEVILAAYSKWGTSCLSHLAGMFAFAIWDIENKELFIARDRMGVKPLYYYEHQNGFLFSSEIRSLLASQLVPGKLNHAAVADFLEFQSVGYPNAIIEGVRSLDAGSYMVVNKSGKVTKKYWKLVDAQRIGEQYDENTTKKKIRELLTQSVQRRMVSDAPLGAFLSGGIDSSAIVGLMASLNAGQINTFTVGFKEKKFDESAYAALIARKFNTCHQTLILEPKSFLDELLPALNSMDTPSGDGINSYTVSKAIRNSGVTVALSGVGGDELFAGYPIFKQYLRLMKWKNLWTFSHPLRKIIAATLFNNNNTRDERFRQLLKVSKPGIGSFYPVFRQIISPQMLAKCTRLQSGSSISHLLSDQYPDLGKLPLLSQVSVAEYMGYTRNTLLNDMDQMSMAVSLEVREPFFDHQLVEFVLNIPDNLKYPSYPKKLLVESMGDLLPPEIVHRKKQGFLIPWNEWMKKDLLSFCESHIQSICERDFINKNELLSYWKRFTANDPGVRWMEMWLFVVLEYWLQKNDVS